MRLATQADAQALSEVLARAFYDDPVITWMIPGDRRRLKVGRRFFALRIKSLLWQQEVWTTDELTGAALWAQPGHWETGLRDVWGMFVALFPDVLAHLPRSLSGLQRVEHGHPKEPQHYYLAVLGTDPESQGQGIGSRLLAPVLDDCDANGIPAYLESSKERNIAFYARHGFQVTRTIEMPGGPPIWLMWREPR